MPALEQKLEMRGEPESPAIGEQQTSQPKNPSEIQVKLSEGLEVTLVDVILEDFHKAKSDRNEKNYGITDKGEKLSFDEWFKRIKDLYSGNRIPKTIPWKFCSNRSLRIGTSVLDLMH